MRDMIRKLKMPPHHSPPPTPPPLLAIPHFSVSPAVAQEGTLSQMGNPKKIDFDALPAMWKAKRQVGNEAKKEGGIDRQKKEDVAKEEMPVKALQAFTLDEDF